MILLYILFVAFIVEFLVKRLFNKELYTSNDVYRLKRYPYINTIQIDEVFSQCSVSTNADCHNITTPLIINDKNGEHIVTLKPNSNNKDSGFLLPNFSAYNDKFKCTPSVGTALLVVDDYAALKKGGTSRMELYCRCKYPELMTNNKSSKLDCTIPVGCKPGGKLIVPKDQNGDYKDPFVFGKCECNKKYTKPDVTVAGPVCRSLVITEITSDDWSMLFKSNESFTIPSTGGNPYVDPDFLRMLPSYVTTLPNPCNVDIRTGKPIPKTEAQVVLINGIATCLPTKLDGKYVTIQTDTDYLFNNNGRYPNAISFASNNVKNKVFFFFTAKSEDMHIGFVYPRSSFSRNSHYLFIHPTGDVDPFYNTTKPGTSNRPELKDFTKIDWKQYVVRVFNTDNGSLKGTHTLLGCKAPPDPDSGVTLCINEENGRLRKTVNLNYFNVYSLDIANKIINQAYQQQNTNPVEKVHEREIRLKLSEFGDI